MFERNKFRKVKQEPGESIDIYYTRLRKLALNCQFADLDEELKQQIIDGCRSSKLRQKGLKNDNLTLSELLEEARSSENCKTYAQAMVPESAGHEVNRLYKKKFPYHKQKKFSSPKKPEVST